MNKHYSTVLILVIALIVAFFFTPNTILLYVAIGMGGVSLLFPIIAAGIHFIWMKLSVVLGSISAFVILSVVYFVFLVPLSFAAKITGKRFLILKRKESTYFKQRNFLYNKESLEDVW